MPGQPALFDHFFVKVDGSDIGTDLMDDLIEIEVETSLHLPDALSIHLHDEKLKWIDDGPFVLGKEVELSAQPAGGGQARAVFRGEITALEPEFGEGTHATLLVRAYDRSHRLHRGTHSKAYQQVTDSDLATRIARDAGLRAQVDATSQVHRHVVQRNQTHMEFLSERAQRIGYELYVEDKTLHFHRPAQGSAALQLEWGKELRSFRPRLSLVEQVDEVFVRGWDVKARQAITGHASRSQAAPQIGERQTGQQMASAAFAGASRVVVDIGVASQAEADSVAQAILDEIAGAFIEAEGECWGQPELRAGKAIELKALGRRLSGTYLVTAATHIFPKEGGYVTRFSVHGRRPDTLSALLLPPGQQAREPMAPMVGIVTNNRDPEGWGRIKVKFPWLSDDVESDWARIAAPGAGPERGLYWLPEVNDEVLVAFEQGDINRPYVVGGLWNGADKPPLANSESLAGGEVHRRVLKTRAGHTLTFTDGSDASVVVETAGGHRLTLADEKKQVRLETAGGLSLEMDDNSREVKLEAGGNLTVKSGTNLTIEATGKLELKGATFSLAASGKGEVDGGGMLEVKGGLVKIN